MRLLLVFACLALSGCAVFTQVLNGLGAFVDENDDGPRFMFARDSQNASLGFAAITPNDTALLLGNRTVGIPNARTERIGLSPNAQYGAAGWRFELFDVLDFGVAVVNVRTANTELSVQDNFIQLDDELACRMPALESATRASALELFLSSGLYDEFDVEGDTLDVEIDIADLPSNSLSFEGWTSDNKLVLRYDFEASATVSGQNTPAMVSYDPLLGENFDGWFPPRIAGPLVYTRNAFGVWEPDACPDPAPRVVRVVPRRNLTLSGGDILLDGRSLLAASGQGTIGQRRVRLLSGAW